MSWEAVVKLDIGACGECGAITKIVNSDGKGIDNSEQHREHHRKLREAVKAIAEEVFKTTIKS